ncbi:MAG: tetratricopeptide repeat protein [Deltaproteobacteria bacterium]|nr:tetratricopeptide repeat protein [Deltaproteobacteria bacterium]
MQEKHCEWIYAVILLFLFSLMSGCVFRGAEKQAAVADGFLIQPHMTSSLAGHSEIWLSDIRAEDPALVTVLEHMETRDWSAAITGTKQLLKKRPFDKDCFLVLATAYAAQGLWDQARFYARLILQAEPDHVAATNIMGLYRLNEADSSYDYERSARWFLESFKASSGEIASGLNLGYLYLNLGSHQKALNIFETVHERCQGCSVAALGLGIAMRRSGQIRQAKRLLEDLVSRSPETMAAWYQLALIMRNNEKDYKASSGYLRHILDQPKLRDVALLEKAKALLEANQAPTPPCCISSARG